MCACVCLPRCQGLRHSGRKWLCEWFAPRVVVRVSEGPLCSLSCPGVNCRGAVRWFRCRGELIVPTCIWLITQTMAALGWMENLILRLWVISPFNYKKAHTHVFIFHLFILFIYSVRWSSDWGNNIWNFFTSLTKTLNFCSIQEVSDLNLESCLHLEPQ